MATWEPTAVARAASAGHWWGPLDGPAPAHPRPAEAEELRGQMQSAQGGRERWDIACGDE